MESQTTNQLYLLSLRITYNEDIFETSASYSLTSDTEINNKKIYFARSGEGTQGSPYVYTEIENPTIDNISTYYERVDKGYTEYLSLLNRLLEDSKYIALSILYPYDDYSEMELPKRYYNWQLRCCVEILQMLGTSNIKSYAENGVSWTKDGGNISNDLYSEIMPSVGVITNE